MIVVSQIIEPKSVNVLPSFLNTQEGCYIFCTDFKELFFRALSMIISCYRRLHYLEIFIVQEKKRCASWSKTPFVKIGKICIRLHLFKTKRFLSNCMSSINKKRNLFFLEEFYQGMNRANKSRFRNNVV